MKMASKKDAHPTDSNRSSRDSILDRLPLVGGTYLGAACFAESRTGHHRFNLTPHRRVYYSSFIKGQKENAKEKKRAV